MSDLYAEFKNDLPDYVKTDTDFETYKMRHSAEHVLTQAMEDLYGIDKVVRAMGPATAEGFYADFEPRGIEINESNFAEIEAKMCQIKGQQLPIVREEVTVEKAREMFKNNPYKQEWLNSIEDKNEKVTIYRNGEYAYFDLCKGPHVDNTKDIGIFKLLKIAGAYWHGDEKNIMLTRIYGVTFKNQKELDAYLLMLEEAKKRDHKKLAKDLDLLVFSPLVGSGLPMYTPRGTVLRSEVYNYSRELNSKIGYDEVATPNFNRAELFKVSGHYEKYKNDMFRVVSQYSEEEMFFKPMNCPQHTQIFASRQRSYKDLPFRVADFSNLARDERPGELNGILRSRIFTQDDGHAFVREDQIKQEFKNVSGVIKEALNTYGLKYKVRLSLWDPENKAKYLGEPETWEKSQAMLKELLDEEGYDYYVGVGEAAIYGPKMDFIAIDALGREWQISTIQIDLIMPKRFGLEYTDVDGTLKTPVMIHRAIVGSERFIAIIIEHFAGAFPAWLSPEQVRVIPISEANVEYGKDVAGKLKAAGIRVELDSENERMQNKIRKAQAMKVPYMLILGKQEQEAGTVSLRYRSGTEIKGVEVGKFITALKANVADRKEQLELPVN